MDTTEDEDEVSEVLVLLLPPSNADDDEAAVAAVPAAEEVAPVRQPKLVVSIFSNSPPLATTIPSICTSYIPLPKPQHNPFPPESSIVKL